MQFAMLYLMVKPIIFSISLFLTTTQARAETCSLTRYNEHVGVVKIGAQSVSVIGWAHMDDDEISRAKTKLDDALTAARMKDCANGNQRLGETLSDIPSSAQMKNYVLRMLEAVQSEAPLQSIGLELTPSELAQGWSQLNVSRAKIDEINAACGTSTRKNIEEIFEIIQGPEVTFALRHDGTSMILPLEDEKAKAENAKAFEQKIPFNDRDPRIGESSRKAIEELSRLAIAQTQPEDSVFDHGVAFAADLAERARLKAELKTPFDIVLQQIRGAHVRNTYIAKNAIATKGNLAIVIGYSHVDDLINQLMLQCKQK